MFVNFTVTDGEYFTHDGEKRACIIVTLWDGEQILYDKHTKRIIKDGNHDGCHALPKNQE